MSRVTPSAPGVTPERARPKPAPRPPRVPVRVLRPGLLAVLMLWQLLPFVPLLLWSVGGDWYFPHLLPTRLSLDSWRQAAGPSSGLVRALLTSASLSTTVALIAAGIGLSAGRALGLYSFRGKRLVEFLILAPVIVPTFAVAMGIQVVFIRLGLADTFLGVVLVHLIPTIPYVTLTMSSVFANYDVTYEEQARVLGASPLKVLRNVTLPMVLPGLVVAALFAFLISWSEYLLTLLIGGGVVQTLPLLLFATANANASPGALAALCLIFIAPAVVLLVATSRFLSGNGIGGFGKL